MIKPWTTPVHFLAVQCTGDNDEAADELPVHTLETGQRARPNVNPHLTATQKEEIEDLQAELAGDFSDEPGLTDVVTHDGCSSSRV